MRSPFEDECVLRRCACCAAAAAPTVSAKFEKGELVRGYAALQVPIRAECKFLLSVHLPVFWNAPTRRESSLGARRHQPGLRSARA